MSKEFKIRTKNNDLFLRVRKGHFATMHSHTNYYIDVTTQKMRLSEAKALAEELVSMYKMTTIVDTILCIDGMEVVGTCIADELTRDDYVNMNAHQTIYVVSPEYISGGQMMFRDNIVPMLLDKHVLIVAASVTTGKSALAAIDAVNYYGGTVVGVAAIILTGYLSVAAIVSMGFYAVAMLLTGHPEFALVAVIFQLITVRCHWSKIVGIKDGTTHRAGLSIRFWNLVGRKKD